MARALTQLAAVAPRGAMLPKSTQEAIVIRGRPALAGSVSVAGYKHALVLVLAASVLLRDLVEFRNVPAVDETKVLIRILEQLGADVHQEGSALRIDPRSFESPDVPQDLSSLIHGSLYLIPPLLLRFGRVSFGTSGGDQIGSPHKGGKRPMAHMLSVLERFGATFDIRGQRVEGSCRKPRAQTIDIMDYSTDPAVLNGPYVSGATKTAVLAAVGSEGTTVIRNPHDKEAVRDLLRFLSSCGSRIELEPGRWVIEGGVGSPRSSHFLSSDTTELITWIACSAFLCAPLTITDITVSEIRRPFESECERLDAMGVGLKWQNASLQITPPPLLRAVNIEATSMGLSTDSHPFFTLMLLRADRPASVTDRVWTHRFGYAESLQKLGTNLRVEPPTVSVTPGLPTQRGRHLVPTDTRAAAVAVLAALAVPGETVITGTHHLDRGYERFIAKLHGLGALTERGPLMRPRRSADAQALVPSRYDDRL